MSWSVSYVGTKKELAEKMDVIFAGTESSYKPGTLEGDDVAACKARAIALVDALTVPEDRQMQLYGFGSHSTSSDGFVAGSFNLSIKDAPAT
jgi:hypothetical protein